MGRTIMASKARIHSWISPYEDEDGKAWEAHVSILASALDPDLEDIDFETAFPTEEAAGEWCDSMLSLLEGTMFYWGHWSEGKQATYESANKRIEVLEAWIRIALLLIEDEEVRKQGRALLGE